MATPGGRRVIQSRAPGPPGARARNLPGAPTMQTDFATLSGIELLLLAAATWRVSHLLVHEAGPWRLLDRLRHRAAGGFFGELLDCSYCTSLWAAAPFALLATPLWRERPVVWLALSALALVPEELAKHWREAPPPLLWHEEPAPSTEGFQATEDFQTTEEPQGPKP